MKRKRLISMLVTVVILFSIGLNVSGEDFCYNFPELRLGRYSVGYKVIPMVDNSRSFSKKLSYSGVADTNTNRPVQYHIWYPAMANPGDTPMTYAEYIGSTFIPKERSMVNDYLRQVMLRDYKAEMTERGADESLLEIILSSRTHAYMNIPGFPGKFPLIIYAPSINSNPYENSLLIEFLVSHGYMVVSSPGFGLHSFEVTRDMRGLMAQFGDLMFLLAQSWDNPMVDHTRIGTIGFSWGGLSNILLAMDNYNIDAVVSLDGAGSIADYLNLLKQMPQYHVNNMTAAYLQFVPAGQKRNSSN